MSEKQPDSTSALGSNATAHDSPFAKNVTALATRFELDAADLREKLDQAARNYREIEADTDYASAPEVAQQLKRVVDAIKLCGPTARRAVCFGVNSIVTDYHYNWAEKLHHHIRSIILEYEKTDRPPYSYPIIAPPKRKRGRAMSLSEGIEFIIKFCIDYWELKTGKQVKTSGRNDQRDEPRPDGATFVVEVTSLIVNDKHSIVLKGTIVRALPRLRREALTWRASQEQEPERAQALAWEALEPKYRKMLQQVIQEGNVGSLPEILAQMHPSLGWRAFQHLTQEKGPLKT